MKTSVPPMFRYRLRTLLIVLALGPPALAGGYWGWWGYCKWKENRELERGMWTSDLVPVENPPAQIIAHDQPLHTPDENRSPLPRR